MMELRAHHRQLAAVWVMVLAVAAETFRQVRRPRRKMNRRWRWQRRRRWWWWLSLRKRHSAGRVPGLEEHRGKWMSQGES